MTKARQLADLGNAYDDGALSNRNKVINGSFKISQRGDYSSATTITNWQYYVDRFVSYGQSNGAKLTHADNSLKLEAFTTATNRMFLMTKLEPVDIQKNNTYTLSFYVTTNSSNFRVHVNDLSSPVLTYTSPSVAVPNGVRTKVSLPITVGSTVTTAFEIAIGLFASGRTNVAITSGDYFILEEVQLEVGDTATPFEHGKSYGAELAACQRYYYKHIDGDTSQVGLGDHWSTNQLDVGFSFPVTMRATPTLIQSGGSDHFESYGGGEVRRPTGNWTQWRPTVTRAALYATPNSNVTVGRATRVISIHPDAFLGFDAEL